MSVKHNQPHDLVIPPEPRAPTPLSCAVCRKEIPPAGGHMREYGDYTLWFCSLACYEQGAAPDSADPPAQKPSD